MQENKNRVTEELAGCREIIRLDAAVLAAVLMQTGPVTVRRDEIRRLVEAKTAVRADVTESGFRLWTEGDDGHGGA